MRIHPVSSLVALLVLLPGCARRESPGVSPMPGTARTWPYLGKARVTNAAKAMVVSGSPIASEVGREILQQGGNAVDAAVAVGFALAVVHPAAGNIGGGGFMLIRLNTGKFHFIDFREKAPLAAGLGAIAGVLGAYFVLLPRARVLSVIIVGFIFLREIPAVWFLGIWIALQIWTGGLSLVHDGIHGDMAFVDLLGVYFLMVSFGASYGYTVMARISLLIGRVMFLLHDWLGVLHL